MYEDRGEAWSAGASKFTADNASSTHAAWLTVAVERAAVQARVGDDKTRLWKLRLSPSHKAWGSSPVVVPLRLGLHCSDRFKRGQCETTASSPCPSACGCCILTHVVVCFWNCRCEAIFWRSSRLECLVYLWTMVQDIPGRIQLAIDELHNDTYCFFDQVVDFISCVVNHPSLRLTGDRVTRGWQQTCCPCALAVLASHTICLAQPIN